MSGVGEASLVLGLISSIIQIITAATDVYNAANDASGLPRAFHDVANKLPIILVLLKQADEFANRPGVNVETCEAFRRILEPSKRRSQELHEIFTKVIPKGNSSWVERYSSAVRKLGKGGRVENLIEEILRDMSLFSAYFAFPEATERALLTALEEMKSMDTSLTDKSEAGSTGSNLQEPRYQLAQSYPEHGSIAVRKAFLRSWLIPEGLIGADSVSDQTSYLDKRFHDPKTSYAACNWIFETAEYRGFANSGSSFLRINGSPGSGKSIISSAIIDRLRADETSLTLYCYGHHDPEPTSSLTLVRVLLHQTLLWEHVEITTQFYNIYSKQPAIDGKIEDELWHLLTSTLASESRKIFIVVDALDEFLHQHIVVRSLIKLITKLSTSSKPCLLVSSRLEGRDTFENDKNIQKALSKSKVQSSQLEITQERTIEDLKQLVSHRINSSPSFELKSEEIKNRVIEGVCDRAGGSFLWANLVLDELKDDRISSPSAIDATLSKLPIRLLDLYKRNLDIPKRSLKGSEVFSWILCSSPALSWQELQSALAIGSSGYEAGELVDDPCEVFIRHSCGPLVESYGPLENIRFIHPTVRDFLVDQVSTGGSGVEVRVAEAHSMVARKLLTFLEYQDLPRFSSKNDNFPEATLRDFSLRPGRGIYHFATFNWYKNLRECGKSVDSQLEKQVLRFLNSSSLIRWLKSAIILARSSGRGDSVSITVDVVDSLQSWVLGRQWSDSQSPAKVQTWIKDFLGLMLDWGAVLDTQPDWINYLHHDLLPDQNSFREILEEESDQGVVQFHSQLILTKSSEPVTWPDRSLAIDTKHDLAFTYDEPFLSCYHMQTGLLTAEILIPVPSNVSGPLLARKGVLSGDGKYLAVMFEALGSSKDPVGAQMRKGHTLVLDDSSFKLSWTLDKTDGSGLAEMMANLLLGIDHAVFLICLLELYHEGPARTRLFTLPRWTSSAVLGIGTQTMRWELDDVDVLVFSSDSTRLATPFGIYDLNSGTKVRPWSPALSMVFHGGKMSTDFATFATISSLDSDSVLHLYDVKVNSKSPTSIPVARQTFDVPGAAHILAISNYGSFVLLLRVQIIEKKNHKGRIMPSAQATIGIWDCCEEGAQQ